MELFWIALVLVSAATHPLRDLTLKGVAHPVSCYVGVCFSWVLLALGHAWMTCQALVLPAQTWAFSVISALGLGVYYYGTLSALRRGNLSVYYPIVRASPVAIVAFSWLLLERDYAAVTLAGIALVLAGSLMIQKSTGGLFEDPRAFVMATLAMLGSAAYSLSDAAAMQHIGSAPFLFFTYLQVTLILGLVRAWEDRGSASPVWGVFRGWIEAPWRILFAGVSSYLSYLLILHAFSIGAEAASVSAVRQASIPVSVVLAAIVLKEPKFLRRIGWAALIAIGIVLITLG